MLLSRNWPLFVKDYNRLLRFVSDNSDTAVYADRFGKQHVYTRKFVHDGLQMHTYSLMPKQVKYYGYATERQLNDGKTGLPSIATINEWFKDWRKQSLITPWPLILSNDLMFGPAVLIDYDIDKELAHYTMENMQLGYTVKYTVKQFTSPQTVYYAKYAIVAVTITSQHSQSTEAFYRYLESKQLGGIAELTSIAAYKNRYGKLSPQQAAALARFDGDSYVTAKLV